MENQQEGEVGISWEMYGNVGNVWDCMGMLCIVTCCVVMERDGM